MNDNLRNIDIIGYLPGGDNLSSDPLDTLKDGVRLLRTNDKAYPIFSGDISEVQSNKMPGLTEDDNTDLPEYQELLSSFYGAQFGLGGTYNVYEKICIESTTELAAIGGIEERYGRSAFYGHAGSNSHNTIVIASCLAMSIFLAFMLFIVITL